MYVKSVQELYYQPGIYMDAVMKEVKMGTENRGMVFLEEMRE